MICLYKYYANTVAMSMLMHYGANRATYDVVIVGGGISGLYCAHLLLKARGRMRVCLLEKTSSLGGLVYGPKKVGKSWDNGSATVVEQGPSYHLDSHSLLKNLIREAKLKSLYTPHMDYYGADGKKIDVDNNLRKLIDICRNNMGAYMKCVHEELPLVPGLDELNDFRCEELASDLEDELQNRGKYVVDGYASLVRFLEDSICGKVTIIKEASVTVIERVSGYREFINVMLDSGIYVTCRDVVLAVPSRALESIRFNDPAASYVNSYMCHRSVVEGKKSARIYLLFKGANKVLRRLYKKGIRNILDYHSSFKWAMIVSCDVLLLSYSNSSNANYIIKNRKDVVKRMENDFIAYANKVLNSNYTTEDISPDYAYVTGGMHGPDAYHVNKDPIFPQFPLSSNGIHYAGESTCNPVLRGWVEGALESAERATKFLLHK